MPTAWAVNWSRLPLVKKPTGPMMKLVGPETGSESAKRPTQRRPKIPQIPWTLIAPTGSSTRSVLSMNRMLATTRAPARTPIRTASAGETKAHDAEIATRPASSPLQPIVGSGLLKTCVVIASAARQPEPEASSVVAAIVASCGSNRLERPAHVEAEPADGQDQAPHDHHRDVVAGDRVRSCRRCSTCRSAGRAPATRPAPSPRRSGGSPPTRRNPPSRRRAPPWSRGRPASRRPRPSPHKPGRSGPRRRTRTPAPSRTASVRAWRRWGWSPRRRPAPHGRRRRPGPPPTTTPARGARSPACRPDPTAGRTSEAKPSRRAPRPDPTIEGRKGSVPAEHPGEPARPEPEHGHGEHPQGHRRGVRGILRPDQAGLGQRETGRHQQTKAAGGEQPGDVDPSPERIEGPAVDGRRRGRRRPATGGLDRGGGGDRRADHRDQEEQEEQGPGPGSNRSRHRRCPLHDPPTGSGPSPFPGGAQWSQDGRPGTTNVRDRAAEHAASK